MDRLAVAIATWFGCGLIPSIYQPAMGGTYGSLAAVPLCFVLLTYGNWQLYIAVTVLILFVGMWSVPHAERALGPRADWRGISRSRDQNQIVIDEVVGMLIACSPILVVAPERIYGPIMLAFAAFRIFDIVKPLGIRVFDRMKSAFGVMMDDVIAGIYAIPFVAAVAWLYR